MCIKGMVSRFWIYGAVTVLAVLVAFASNGFTQNSAEAATNYKVNFSGIGADAYWDSCTETECSYTGIGVSENSSRNKGDKSSAVGLWYYDSTYNFVTDEYVFRYGYTDNVQFKITQPKNKLAGVKASGNVLLTVCDNYDCYENGTVSVVGSWVGQGTIQQNRGKSIYTFDGVKIVYGDRSKYRPAVADILVDGNPLGVNLGGYIYDFKSSFMEIVK